MSTKIMKRCHFYRDHLKAWLDQELRGWKRWQIKRHLQRCLACQRECESLRSVSLRLQALDEPVAPNTLRDRIMLAVAMEVKAASEPPRRVVPWRWAWGLPALMGIVFASVWLTNRPVWQSPAANFNRMAEVGASSQGSAEMTAAPVPESMISRALNEPELLKKAESVSVEVEVESLTAAFESTLSAAEQNRAALVKANYQSAASESSGANLLLNVPLSRARVFLKAVTEQGRLASEQFEMRQEMSAPLVTQKKDDRAPTELGREFVIQPAVPLKSDTASEKENLSEGTPSVNRPETEAKSIDLEPPSLNKAQIVSDADRTRKAKTEEPKREETVIRVQIKFTSPSHDNRHPGK